MSEPPSTRPARQAPPPLGWPSVRRWAPREERTFHDVVPTPTLKFRLSLGVCCIVCRFLLVAAIFALPGALWLAAQFGWLRRPMDFVVLERLGVAAGLLMLFAKYALDSFAHKRLPNMSEAE